MQQGDGSDVKVRKGKEILCIISQSRNFCFSDEDISEGYDCTETTTKTDTSRQADIQGLMRMRVQRFFCCCSWSMY
jgi:hypothetical protein